MVFPNPYIADIVLTEAEIVRINDDLAHQIETDYQDKPLVLVGILDGCHPFLSDLIKKIRLPLRVAYLKLSIYAGTFSPVAESEIQKMNDIDFSGCHVLVVDDIFDSGKSLRKILTWFSAHTPASVRTCVLLSRKAVSDGDFSPDYVGHVCESVSWIIGYGLDYKGLLRNLPYVATLNKTFQDMNG